MALASALAFEARKLGIRAGGVTVDHGLQDGSDAPRRRGRRPAGRASASTPSRPSRSPSAASGGPEAAARDARYAALDAAAERHGAAAVLLGHTRDDQAETVLLGLARGSGIRSLSGMAAVSGAAGRYRRPFLQLDRQTARKACLVQSPARSGTTRTTPTPPTPAPGCATRACPRWRSRSARASWRRLARTAQLSRDDADALDAWAAEAEDDRQATTAGRWSAPSYRPCRPPSAAGCCAARPSRRARRPARSSPATSRRSTG